MVGTERAQPIQDLMPLPFDEELGFRERKEEDSMKDELLMETARAAGYFTDQSWLKVV